MGGKKGFEFHETAGQAALRQAFECIRNHDDAAAGALLREAMASDDADSAAIAALQLGVLLRRLGDEAAACTAYQAAIDAHNPYASPRAACELGWILKASGDLAGAETAYRVAVASRNSNFAPPASYRLGRIFQGQGRITEAVIALQAAVDSEHPQFAPSAADALARIRLAGHEMDEAESLFTLAAASPQPDVADRATVTLAAVWWAKTDPDRAEAALKRIIDTGPADILALGRAALGLHLASRGRAEEAEPLLRSVLGDADPAVMTGLAEVIIARGQAEAVETFHRLGHPPAGSAEQAISSSAGLPAALAARTEQEFLAALEIPMAPPDVLAEAEQLLRSALAAGKQAAAVLLAAVLQGTERFDEAERLLRAAVEADVRNSLTAFAHLLINREHRRTGVWSSDEAIDLLERAVRGGDMHALDHLACYYVLQGDNARGELALRQSADAGSSFARSYLIITLAEQGRVREAHELFTAMVERGDQWDFDVFEVSMNGDEFRTVRTALLRARDTQAPAHITSFINLLTGMDPTG